MRKIIFAVFACSVFLILAPSFSAKAYTLVGQALFENWQETKIVDLYINPVGEPDDINFINAYGLIGVYISGYGYDLKQHDPNSPLDAYNLYSCYPSEIKSIYISTLTTQKALTYNGNTTYCYNNIDDYYNSLPEDLRPEEPSAADVIWDAFYELYYDLFGFYPLPGSLFDLLRGQSVDDEDFEIIYPTITPSPTPSPTPTPIPVQTIFVPDGNGNTTIIYQYPDPTSGLITQSPYNPNIENNITVNCDCDGSGGSGDNTFGTDPQDPYTLTSSMLWADGFGVEISDNPLTTANESQQTLAEAASDYSNDVKVVSNAFNILPAKWISLVGLLGGILIIAGLIRTFLGG